MSTPTPPNPTVHDDKTGNVDPGITAAWQADDIAQRYKTAENATRPFARLMIDTSLRLVPLPTSPSERVSVFDLACGTGAVEAELYDAVGRERWDALDVLAGDISAPMIEYAAQRGREEGWKGLVTRIVDGAALDAASTSLSADESGEETTAFTHVFVGFAIFVLPADTLRKLVAKVAPGGSLGVTSWAHLPWYDVLCRAHARLSDGPPLPGRAELYKAIMDGRAWWDAGFVREQLEGVGLERVEVVQRKERVGCGTPDLFMTTMAFVLQMMSKRWAEERREAWLGQISDAMRQVLVEDAGGETETVWMEFEGIVGVGVRG